MNKKIMILPGDGIGPEVVREAVKILNWFNDNTRHKFEMVTELIGGAAIDRCGKPLPDATINSALNSDAVLLGAVGGPKWEHLPMQLKPEKGLLEIRQQLELFANLRPAMFFSPLADASPIKPEIVAGLDLMIVRELTGDIYFGQPRGIATVNNERVGVNTMHYTVSEIERVARTAFDLARQRKKSVCSVDKANVLETMQLWRETVQAVHDKDYVDISLSHMYVDNAAMQLIRNPKHFDVMLTPNMFGDILSDESSMLTGSLGMLPSASLGKVHALYEPIHGSAPDIAGKNIANPIGTILSVAMMFQYSFKLEQEASMIKNAVDHVLAEGFRTQDIMSASGTLVSTEQMGKQVIAALEKIA